MWTEINSEKDIEDFMRKTEMDDWDNLEIISLKYEKYNISMIVECRTFGRLEMFFKSVHHFSNFRLGRSYHTYCNRCCLQFRYDLLGKTRNDRLILWTDSPLVANHDDIFNNEDNNTVVIAYGMKYRFIDIIDDDKTEQSLKEIVEENYLIEITWDNFWENFDDFIKSGEAEEYGITDRESVEAYLWAYALKHFPGNDTLIIITIKFESAENGQYLGYYDLLFNMNLEITDDFFVLV